MIYNVSIAEIKKPYVQLIKDFRSATGLPTKETKEYIDGMRYGSKYNLELNECQVQNLQENGFWVHKNETLAR